jgi:hypothetical protein
MKRLTSIAGQLVAVQCQPGDARSLDTRRLRRADPADVRPVQWHAWAPGYGSAFGDTIEEACDTLGDQWRHVSGIAFAVPTMADIEALVARIDAHAAAAALG